MSEEVTGQIMRKRNVALDLQTGADIIFERKRALLQGEELQQFEAKEKLFKNQRLTQLRKLTYGGLAEKFKMFGIPLRTIFDEVHIPLEEPYSGFYALDAAISKLPDAEQKIVLSVVLSLSASFWRQDTPVQDPLMREQVHSPFALLWYVTRHDPDYCVMKDNMYERLSARAKAEFTNVLHGSGRGDYNMSGRSMIEVSNALQLNPAWLFGWANGKYTLLASTPVNEIILSGYRFLLRENQMVVLRLIQSLQYQVGCQA